ncbi:MAG TPA: zf-HC2 domain-containing protein [Candidatus Aminicenantes bacterium]|nr:zf-HC2 domain-containing protein [Candidatus Aminicenantes bacterium]
MTGHLTEDDVAGYLDHRLDSRRQREVEAHLAGCDDCLAQVADVAAALAEPASLPQGLVPAREARWELRPAIRWRPVFGVAAVLLVVLSVAVVLRVERRLPLAPAAEERATDQILAEGRELPGEPAAPAPPREQTKAAPASVPARRGHADDSSRLGLAPEAKGDAVAAGAPSVSLETESEASRPRATEAPVAQGVLPAPGAKAERGVPFADHARKAMAKVEASGRSREEGEPFDPRLRLEGELAPAELVDPSPLRGLLAEDWGADLVIRFAVDAAGRIGPDWTCQPELSPSRRERLRVALARVRFTPAGRERRRGVLRLAQGEPAPR